MGVHRWSPAGHNQGQTSQNKIMTSPEIVPMSDDCISCQEHRQIQNHVILLRHHQHPHHEFTNHHQQTHHQQNHRQHEGQKQVCHRVMNICASVLLALSRNMAPVWVILWVLIGGARSEMRFLVQPGNRSVAEGSVAVLNCTVANRVGMVQWTKGGFGLGVDRSLPGFDRYSVTGVEKQGVIDEFNLQILDVSVDDEDWYECQVLTSEKYSRGLRSQRAYLSVIVPPERPSIIQAPTIPVVLYTPTNITCRADKGKPGAHITWHLDGQRLTYGVNTYTQKRGKYFDTISVLTFNATLSDAAKRIECQAITDLMESPFRTFATLDVQYVPDLKMIVNVTGRNIKEHDYVRFQCTGYANPATVTWSWYRNDHPIKDADSDTYHIQAVSSDYNNDKISCESTNSVGSSRVDKMITVEYGPRIADISEVVGADIGHAAELTCAADGNPEPNIIWRRKDRTTYTHRTLSTKKIYHIERVNEHDFGWYVCTATVIGFPDTSREAMLLKNDRPKMRSEKQQMASESERGKLECIAHSIPKPKSIIWFKGGKEINYAMSGQFSKEDKDILYGVKSILHIQSVQSGDFGMYNCTVENDYGIGFDQIELVQKHVLPITYIIIAIIGGIAVIFVTALICVLYRRCKKEDQGSVLGEIGKSGARCLIHFEDLSCNLLLSECTVRF